MQQRLQARLFKQPRLSEWQKVVLDRSRVSFQPPTSCCPVAHKMQRRPPPPARVLDVAAGSICDTSNAILGICLSCPTGVQTFSPLASPLVRAHGDVLELDALCKQHALLCRQVAVSECCPAPISHSAFTDAELPQVSRKQNNGCLAASSRIIRRFPNWKPAYTRRRPSLSAYPLWRSASA